MAHPCVARSQCRSPRRANDLATCTLKVLDDWD
jgi:hypothetical protein